MIKAVSRQQTLPDLLASRAPAHVPETGVIEGSLRWVIGIRYKIGLLLFAILIVAYALGVISTGTTIRLAFTDLLYLLASLFYSYTLNQNPSLRRITLIRNLQVPELLVLATTATYYSGGVLSPLFILFPLAILQAIILLQPTGVYRTGVFAVALYCSLALLEIWGKGQPGSLNPFPGIPLGRGVPQQISPPIGGAEGSLASTYALYVAIVSSVLLLTAYIGNRVAHLIRHRNQQIEIQLQDSQILYDVANKLGNMVDEEQILTYLAVTSKLALDAERRKVEGGRVPFGEEAGDDNASMCLIGLLNKDGKFEIRASAGAPAHLTLSSHGITSSTAGLENLFQHGETLIIDDIQQHHNLKEFALSSPVIQNSSSGLLNSVYIFPIKAESTVIGGIILSSSSKTHNSKLITHNSLVALMTSITAQAALAIQRAQLTADAQRLANEMSQLYTLGLYTGSTLSKDEVLRRTSDNIESLMNPHAYYIALYDEVSDLLSFEVFMEHGRQLAKMKIPLDKGGVTSRIIQRGNSILVQDWSNTSYELEVMSFELERSQKTQNSKLITHNSPDMLSYLGVPMLWEDRVIGVISVQCEEAMSFDPHDERLLMALAAQTAMAIENARLHQLAQDQGKLDSLTLVYNHGYFVELVRNAVAQSDTEDTQVALIMLDIDHFKHYNDSFGHVAGDSVLRMVAQALKSSMRETDAVGRWGGEEFGVLLLGVGITEAKKIARQVRRAISELSPVNGHGQVLPNPTISQGISSYPYPSATANDLIEEADTALYHAKKHGRNQLVVYEAAGGMKDDTTTTGHLTRTKASKNLVITTGDLRRSKHAKHLEEEVFVTTNDLVTTDEGTNPQLTGH